MCMYIYIYTHTYKLTVTIQYRCRLRPAAPPSTDRGLGRSGPNQKSTKQFVWFVLIRKQNNNSKKIKKITYEKITKVNHIHEESAIINNNQQ